MPLYEHVFLARQDASAQQVDDLTNQFKAIIEGQGGKVAKTEYWGVKSLTYRMNKNRKAHFTLMNVDAPAAAISRGRAPGASFRRSAALHHDPRRRTGGRSLRDDAQVRS